jgi:phage FluMu protein Com
MNLPLMVVYSCKKCGELNYLTPHAFWNLTDFRAKCERCDTINTITLENGELKNRYKWGLTIEDFKT